MSTAQSLRKEYSLRRQESTLNKKSSKKKDGTLQKIGDFFQSSPTIIHSKGLYSIRLISYSLAAVEWQRGKDCLGCEDQFQIILKLRLSVKYKPGGKKDAV